MSLFARSTKPLETASALVAVLLVLIVGLNAPETGARSTSAAVAIQERLDRGEVVVDMQDIGDTKYVVGRVMINQPADRVWPIMTNPYEFKGKICPRMKDFEVMIDKPRISLLKVNIDCTFLLPNVFYVVESRYEPNARIDFHRVSGTIKDFKGFWLMNQTADGKRTELTYSMYIDPGFPVPQWIVREGVKGELPKTLIGIRRRVEAICQSVETPEPRSIAAAQHSLTANLTNSN